MKWLVVYRPETLLRERKVGTVFARAGLPSYRSCNGGASKKTRRLFSPVVLNIPQHPRKRVIKNTQPKNYVILPRITFTCFLDGIRPVIKKPSTTVTERLGTDSKMQAYIDSQPASSPISTASIDNLLVVEATTDIRTCNASCLGGSWSRGLEMLTPGTRVHLQKDTQRRRGGGGGGRH